MKKYLVLVSGFVLLSACNSNPLSAGQEFKCTTVAIHRIVGNKMEEIKVPSNTKPFYIAEKNTSLVARYREPGSPEVSDNNAMLVKSEVADDQGRKFDVAIYKKIRKDGENEIRIFKEINGKTTQLTMASLSKYTDTPAVALRMVHFCE